ncbi:MAG TPA: cytochrome c oxidase subunit II [bacterium]|nr:cytochrome c oxidase subunit II [bacterium]
MDTTRSLFLPPQASTVAPDVDALFNFLLWMSVAFFALIMTLTVIFVVKYRRRGAATLTPGLHHNTALEMTWIVIPLILVGIIFVWGFRSFMAQNVVPKDAMEIKVSGQKWFWSFTYPDGLVMIDTLVVPAGKPIRLLMSSQDVIHSFFVPDFRIKRDVLPNRYTIAWFEAPKPGNHNLFCAEYCGKEHSGMIGEVRVLGEREYAQWLETAAFAGEGMAPEEYGAKLYVSKTCVTCHSNDGKAGTGPTFVGRFGKEVALQKGGAVLMDENYIRESILNPQAKVAAGYQPVMPTFQGLLKAHEVDALVAFIKSLNPSTGQ